MKLRWLLTCVAGSLTDQFEELKKFDNIFYLRDFNFERLTREQQKDFIANCRKKVNELDGDPDQPPKGKLWFPRDDLGMVWAIVDDPRKKIEATPVHDPKRVIGANSAAIASQHSSVIGSTLSEPGYGNRFTDVIGLSSIKLRSPAQQVSTRSAAGIHRPVVSDDVLKANYAHAIRRIDQASPSQPNKNWLNTYQATLPIIARAIPKKPPTIDNSFTQCFDKLNKSGYLDLSGFNVLQFTNDQKRAFLKSSNEKIFELERSNAPKGKLWAPINYWAQGWIKVDSSVDSVSRPEPNGASRLAHQYKERLSRR